MTTRTRYRCSSRNTRTFRSAVLIIIRNYHCVTYFWILLWNIKEYLYIIFWNRNKLTLWPSGLRRNVKAVVLIGGGSNPLDVRSPFASFPSLGSIYSVRIHTSFLASHLLFFFDDKTQNMTTTTTTTTMTRDDDNLVKTTTR